MLKKLYFVAFVFDQMKAFGDNSEGVLIQHILVISFEVVEQILFLRECRGAGNVVGHCYKLKRFGEYGVSVVSNQRLYFFSLFSRHYFAV
jgi:hypothetical protein